LLPGSSATAAVLKPRFRDGDRHAQKAAEQFAGKILQLERTFVGLQLMFELLLVGKV
jgi:hypothetical protein